jgi:hypothetical protein
MVSRTPGVASTIHIQVDCVVREPDPGTVLRMLREPTALIDYASSAKLVDFLGWADPSSRR